MNSANLLPKRSRSPDSAMVTMGPTKATKKSLFASPTVTIMSPAEVDPNKALVFPCIDSPPEIDSAQKEQSPNVSNNEKSYKKTLFATPTLDTAGDSTTVAELSTGNGEKKFFAPLPTAGVNPVLASSTSAFAKVDSKQALVDYPYELENCRRKLKELNNTLNTVIDALVVRDNNYNKLKTQLKVLLAKESGVAANNMLRTQLKVFMAKESGVDAVVLDICKRLGLQ